MIEHGHEQLILHADKRVGLNAIISIHRSSQGPALGGVRFKTYSSEEEAIFDALKLSEGMTYKCAAAGLENGGAKAVLIANEGIRDRRELFRAFGRIIDSLNGRFYTGEDLGTTPDDMAIISMETKYVSGLPLSMGGEGDPSPYTARGVFLATQAGLKEVYGSTSVKNKTVAIQGLGSVGFNLAKNFHENGAHLLVADVDDTKLRSALDSFDAEIIAPSQIYEVEADIFAPCALGSILDDESIAKLRCKLVAGAANNQLADFSHAQMLRERNILYLPDFVINSGGLLFLTHRMRGLTFDEAVKEVENIYETATKVLEISKRYRISPLEAGHKLAETRLREHVPLHNRSILNSRET